VRYWTNSNRSAPDEHTTLLLLFGDAVPWCTIDWTAIGALGQWVAGLATFCIVIYTVFSDYWRRPKLILSFDNERDVKSQEHTVGLPSSTLSRWLRVRVVNANKRRVAKNCRAFVIGIEKIQPGSAPSDVFPNDVRQLYWMHDPSPNPSARDLLPGVAHWVDVLAAFDNLTALSVRVSPPWSLDTPGNYVIIVQVAAEEASPSVISIQANWDGAWHSLRGDLLR
jgi:hypothetical protein